MAVYHISLDERYDELICMRDYFPNTLNLLNDLLNESFFKCDIVNHFPNLKRNNEDIFYDFKCYDAMKIKEKISSEFGISITAKDVAKNIISNIPPNNFISKCDISNDFFINIRIEDQYITDVCRNMILVGKVPPPFINFKKVLVECSSIDIAEEMSFDHLRSTVLGETICKIFEYVYFDVTRVCHISDFGLSLGMIIAHIEDYFSYGNQKLPEFFNIREFFTESKLKYINDDLFKEKAIYKVLELQNGFNRDLITIGRIICDISLFEIHDIYKKLGLNFIERKESLLQPIIKYLMNYITTRSGVETYEICNIREFPDVQNQIYFCNSYGIYSHETYNFASLMHVISEDKAEWILYIVQRKYSDDIEKIFNFAKIVKLIDPNIQIVEKICYGTVVGEDEYEIYDYDDKIFTVNKFLQECVYRSTKIVEKDSSLKQFIGDKNNLFTEFQGYSCAKYSILYRKRKNDFILSLDRIFLPKGYTAIFLHRTYMKFRLLLKKAKLRDYDVVDYVNFNFIRIDYEDERILLRKIIEFPEVIYRIVYDQETHRLCKYLDRLCRLIRKMYRTANIIDPFTYRVKINTISIIYAASMILNKGFDLLGISIIEYLYF